MELQNKRVLLTGACGGIGSVIAQLLAKKGTRLLLVGRSAEKLETLKATLAKSDNHQIIVADLLTSSGVDALNIAAHRHAEQCGIDIVINNAGYNQFEWLCHRQPNDVIDEVFINLTSPMLLAQSSIHWLNRPGIILNVGSTLGSIGHPGYSAYCAAKAGLHRFSEALDRELSDEGVRVLYLAPRTTTTALNTSLVQEMNAALGNRSDDPSIVAEHVVAVIEQEIAQRWIGSPEKWFVKINQWFPSLVGRQLQKQKQTMKRFLQRHHTSN